MNSLERIKMEIFLADTDLTDFLLVVIYSPIIDHHLAMVFMDLHVNAQDRFIYCNLYK